MNVVQTRTRRPEHVKPFSSDTVSDKVILFLTGGQPADATSPTDPSEPGYSYYGGDILQDIRERNARLNNSVIILTYGIGDGQ